MMGKYIPREAIVNHRLERFVVDGEWHGHSQMIRRKKAA